MARFFDEKCEGAGYEEGWTESITSGDTIDEDANSSDVSSPSGWGSQCLKYIKVNPGSTRVYSDLFASAKVICYVRHEIVITAEGLGNGGTFLLGRMADSGNSVFFVWNLYQTGGNLYFRVQSNHDGSPNYYNSLSTISLNTRYRIEVKWDATNDLWAWRIDGVDQPNDQDGSDPVESEGALTSTHKTNTKRIQVGGNETETITFYSDLIACDDAAWIGAEVAAGWTHMIYGKANASISKIYGKAKANIAKVYTV